MPLDERVLEQNDPDLETIADLQRSITATLTYLMGRASVAELFGLQGYLSQLASRMTDVGNDHALRQHLPSDEQIREMQRQAMLQGRGPNGTPAPYRQEG